MVARFFIVLLLCCSTACFAELVPFATDEGLDRLSRSNAKTDFPYLANQFEAQSNRAFCGPTSSAIVLNALFAGEEDLPRDPSRLTEADKKMLPPGFDLTVPRFTQESVITKGSKTRAQVLGEPMLINGKEVRDGGYQLRQLDEMLRANGAKTHMQVVYDELTLDEVRQALVENLHTPQDYVIVAYKRSAVGQQGGGHISPLAAYDETSDSFLVMDVNPTRAGWVWMPAETLVAGMQTFDRIENRGYILLSK